MIFVHQNLISNRLTYLVHAKSTGLAIAQSEVWYQLNAQLIAETKRTKRLHFLADLWSQSEFRTQRKSRRKTDPKSEMIEYVGATLGRSYKMDRFTASKDHHIPDSGGGYMPASTAHCRISCVIYRTILSAIR